jgi:poly-gamma-glutamate system protein
MDRIRQYKQQRSIPISPLDFHQTGIIGDSFTGITTTLGAIEAKRTSANSDMAALAVELLYEAGVRKGDTVGAGFSGSFPGFNLAVMSACAAMDVNLVYISSVGSSTYGATNPELTFPDMAWLLVEDGLLPIHSAAITPGGQNDCGQDMDAQILSEILTRLKGYNIPLLQIEDHQQNIAARMAFYEQRGPISCFIAVGGNTTTTGKDYIELGQGLIPPYSITQTGPRSGLIEIYSSRGLPVINFLNIKKLVADYGLPYDPSVPPELGGGSIYYETAYSKPLIAAALAITAALLYCCKQLFRRR